MTCAVALMAVLALAVAGCGSDSSSSGGAYGGSSGGDTSESSTASAETKPTPSAAGGDGIVSAAKAGDLGTVIVDSEGFTLYDFHKDKGGKSSCYGACAGAWPPLLTEGNPQAQGAAQRNLLGTTERTDGTLQVTREVVLGERPVADVDALDGAVADVTAGQGLVLDVLTRDQHGGAGGGRRGHDEAGGDEQHDLGS
jgi:predicted lipoprotein with Yx(FWY)xxD motif